MKIPLKLDLTETSDLSDMHHRLAKVFGFPEFYGKNYPALVDCLSSLRYPEDGMTSVALASDSEVIELQVRGLASCNKDILSIFLSAIETANDRLIQKALSPAIYLLLTRDA
jgi:hypothetical protein